MSSNSETKIQLTIAKRIDEDHEANNSRNGQTRVGRSRDKEPATKERRNTWARMYLAS